MFYLFVCFTVCVFLKTEILHSRSIDLCPLLAKGTPCIFTCRCKCEHRDLTEEKRLSASVCRALCLKITGRALRRKSLRRKRCACVSVVFFGLTNRFHAHSHPRGRLAFMFVLVQVIEIGSVRVDIHETTMNNANLWQKVLPTGGGSSGGVGSGSGGGGSHGHRGSSSSNSGFQFKPTDKKTVRVF